jgi:hypothetical protein
MSLQRLSALPLVVFGGIVSWWAWKSGGYFEVTYLPGTIVLLLVVALFLFAAPPLGRLRGAALVSFVALVGLAAWTLISGIWSPVPAVAFSDAQRALAYVAAFAIGAWSCLLLGRRMLLALAPLAAAGALVGLATLIVLWTGHNSHDFFETDATLRYPIGYRNAEAAFFLMAVFPAIVLAASRELPWAIRGVLLGAATLMIELGVLAQSRASLFAVPIGVAVLVAVHPHRLRILGWLTLSLIPAAIALPQLLDVFQRDAGNGPAEIPPLHHACVAIALTGVLSIAIGLAMARFGGEFSLSNRARNFVGRGLLACLAVVVLAGFAALLRADGGPGGFVSRHVNQLTAGSPDLASNGSRFGLDVSTERGVFWRVALRDEFEANPLGGAGAGAFRSDYLQHRQGAGVEPEDPHSVEMLMLGELGLPGTLLFLTFVGGGVVAVIRARSLGSSEAALAAGALALGGYWLAHASVDWFWSYAVITLPVPFALGAAVAPALRRGPEAEAGPPVVRTAIAIGACLLALTIVPFYLSARYTDNAIRNGRANPQTAFDDLDRAADLNPWSSRPLAAESALAEEVGDHKRALSSIDDAISRSRDDWHLYLQQAKVLGKGDLPAAAAALARARELNPQGPEIDELAGDLGIRH